MIFFLDANICLDLLDTKRNNAAHSVSWYLEHKDDPAHSFYFSGDFLTTFYYIMTEKKKKDPMTIVNAIDALAEEIPPFYLAHSDFVNARGSFHQRLFDDFEDLMMLESAIRAGTKTFVTNDKALLQLGKFKSLAIIAARSKDKK